jgi:hypothetical protein
LSSLIGWPISSNLKSILFLLKSRTSKDRSWNILLGTVPDRLLDPNSTRVISSNWLDLDSESQVIPYKLQIVWFVIQ